MRSSSLPGGWCGSGRPSPPAWPCSRWGLPSRRVASPLVRSYIKGRNPAPFHPYRGQGKTKKAKGKTKKKELAGRAYCRLARIFFEKKNKGERLSGNCRILVIASKTLLFFFFFLFFYVFLFPFSFFLFRFSSPPAVSFCCTFPPFGEAGRNPHPLQGVGVTHHRALWSPDFPPGRTEVLPSDRPASPSTESPS